jgi:hypothetical protein
MTDLSPREAVARIIDPAAWRAFDECGAYVLRTEDSLRKADEILALPRGGVPAGWKLVPERPADDLVEAMAVAYEGSACIDPLGSMEDAYRALLSTSPPIPEGGWRPEDHSSVAGEPDGSSALPRHSQAGSATPSEGYSPELGQAVFGQPWQAFPVPDILDAALEAIRHEVQRVLWNLRQHEIDPFGNSAGSFRCPTFTVCAYSWNDGIAQPYNFKHPASGLLVSWYKYMGRGMSANMDVSPDLAARILTHCLRGMKAVESGEHRWDEPGLYPDGALEEAPEGVADPLASDGEARQRPALQTTEHKALANPSSGEP